MDETLGTRRNRRGRGRSTAPRPVPLNRLEASPLPPSPLEARLAERQRGGCRPPAVDWSFDRYCSTRFSYHPHVSSAHADPAHGRATLEIDPAHVALLAPLVKALDESLAESWTAASAVEPLAGDRDDHSPDGAPPEPDTSTPPEPSATTPPEPGGSEEVNGSLQSDLSESLTVFETVERAKAVLDAQALDALARMHATAEAMIRTRPALPGGAGISAEELVTLEVATATGLSQHDVGRRLALATGPQSRCGRLRQLLATGQTTLHRACEVLEDTRGLSDEDVDAIVTRVFAPTRDGAGLSNALFRSRLRRGIIAADEDRAARRRNGKARIGAHAQINDDGTGTLTIINDADKIAAAIDRADAAARAAKAKGDPRTLAQLRADFLTDAANFGWPDPAQGGSFDRIGRHPAAQARVIIPFSTLVGLDDAPCELTGHGWLAADLARALVSQPDSTWQCLLADLDTGKALRLYRAGYRPSPEMIAHVRAVDGTCRGPGCQVPADRCDLDHDTPYPIGPTDITNFTDKHRQHHRVKTARFWAAVRGEHDSLIWTTAAGRRYVTYPLDWLESTRPARPGGDGSVNHNPEAFTRPLGPEPAPDGPRTDPEPPPF